MIHVNTLVKEGMIVLGFLKRNRFLILGITLLSMLLLPTHDSYAAASSKNKQSNFISLKGIWNTYSYYFYYDAGGGEGTESGISLRISGDHWYYGSSSGTFKILPIKSSDWKHWGVKPYGPTKKIVWYHWGRNGNAEGPIETQTVKGHLYVDFIWVIYHEKPPFVQYPGSLWIKFGH